MGIYNFFIITMQWGYIADRVQNPHTYTFKNDLAIVTRLPVLLCTGSKGHDLQIDIKHDLEDLGCLNKKPKLIKKGVI
jgi:hypothetical protein